MTTTGPELVWDTINEEQQQQQPEQEQQQQPTLVAVLPTVRHNTFTLTDDILSCLKDNNGTMVVDLPVVNAGENGHEELQSTLDELMHPEEVKFKLSKRDRTATKALQYNRHTSQEEIKVHRELNLEIEGVNKRTFTKGDFLEIRAVHTTAGYGQLYKVKPVGTESIKDLSVIESVAGNASYRRDEDGTICVRIENFNGKTGIKINTLSTSEHNNGKKEAARFWSLSLFGSACGQLFKSHVNLQVFETLRDPDRLVRAAKRRAEADNERAGRVNAVAPAGKRAKSTVPVVVRSGRVTASRKQLEARFLELQALKVQQMPDEVLKYNILDMEKTLQN